MSEISREKPRVLGENEENIHFITGRGQAEVTPQGLMCKFVLNGPYNKDIHAAPEVVKSFPVDWSDDRLAIDPALKKDAALWVQEPDEVMDAPGNPEDNGEIRISPDIVPPEYLL